MNAYSRRNPAWPTSDEVIAYWCTLPHVPDIEVRPWSPERWHEAPWDKKADFGNPNHWYNTSSPQDHTAYWIACEFRTLKEELRIAFVVEAYCRQMQLRDFMYGVVWRLNREYDGPSLGWWHPNAKWVLPSSAADYWVGRPRHEAEQAERWRQIVERAADQWRELANEWVVVRVPKFMDPDSSEYAAYKAWADERIEKKGAE